jgi:hypothetical protein
MSIITAIPKKGANAIKDAHFNDVVLLLHGNGANGGDQFIDNSRYHHTPTVVGNTNTSSDIPPLISGESIEFDGNGDYLSYDSADEFNFGNRDFTIELTFMLKGYAEANPVGDYFAALIEKFSQDNSEYQFILQGTADSFYRIQFISWMVGGTYVSLLQNMAFYLNTIYTVGVRRKNNLFEMYVNYARVAFAESYATIVKTNAPLRVGAVDFGLGYNYWLNGYNDEIRITNGVARDLTNPQTEPFPDS